MKIYIYIKIPLKIYLKTIKRKNKVSKDNNISKIQADISKITKKTGWYPKYNFEEGVEKIIRNIRN